MPFMVDRLIENPKLRRFYTMSRFMSSAFFGSGASAYGKNKSRWTILFADGKNRDWCSRVEHEEFLFEEKEFVFYHFSMTENELLCEYLL